MLIGATLGRYWRPLPAMILGVFLTASPRLHPRLRRADAPRRRCRGRLGRRDGAARALPHARRSPSRSCPSRSCSAPWRRCSSSAASSSWWWRAPPASRPGSSCSRRARGARIGAFTIGVYNPVSAELKQRSTEIEAKIFARSSKAGSGKDLWIRQRSIDGQAIIRAETAVEGTTTLAGVAVFTFDDGGLRTADAGGPGHPHDGYWELQDVRVQGLDQEPQSYDTYLIASTLDPSQCASASPRRIRAFLATEPDDRPDRAGGTRRHPLPPPVRRADGAAVLFLAMVLVRHRFH